MHINARTHDSFMALAAEALKEIKRFRALLARAVEGDKKKRVTLNVTPISDFVRNASPQEKERVYEIVLKNATAEQRKLSWQR